MRAVLHWLRREDDDSRPPTSKPSTTNLLFLLFHQTIAVCAHEPSDVFPPPFPDCLHQEWLEMMRPLVYDFGRSASASFRRRNAVPLPIGMELGPDVVFIPAEVDNGARLRQFAQQYRWGSEIVRLSAPIYPAAGIALVAYRRFWRAGGFVRVGRANGVWSVLQSNSRLE